MALGVEVPDAYNPIAAQLRQLQVVKIDDTGTCSDSVNREIAQTFPGAWLLVPLHFRAEAWGSLCVLIGSRPHRWQEEEVELAYAVASQLAIAIQQSQLYQQLHSANQELHSLALKDGLTNIANRRCFDQYLEQEWQRQSRSKAALSLILCDVDRFKAYNDIYGHQMGDDCLRQVAAAISRILKRPADLVARYGGEEFGLILPNTEINGAMHIAEEIRSQVKALAISHPNSQYITLSLGVACIIPNYKSSPATLIAAADRALYQAKEQGRDRAIAGIISLN
jgi:diguanylate cyclase (GGDEF)-like protein